ncbi:MAG: EthD domain-containing protein [Gammaproteobacteria bacterium]|nr:EthD domain-containing protein [Gammaproteobacteria bacterium]
MITLNHLVRRQRHVARDDFRQYWLGSHADTRRRLAPRLGVRRFVTSETLHDDDVSTSLLQIYHTGSDAYDFVDQMVIPDFALLKQGLADVETCAELVALHRSEAGQVDYARSDYWVTTDIPQIFPAEHYEATWENTFLKAYYVPCRQARLSLAEAQLHWHSCHGGMAREFKAFLPFVKYVQAHRLPSRAVDQLKRLLDTEFENNDRVLGQAECWLDRRVMPSLAGPEVERMMRMLVEDIELFAESAASYIFAGKEHVFLNQPLYAGSIPVLFDVN